MQELYHRLMRDIKKCGISVDFTLELKPYSKTYYGRYNPELNKITVYVYEDKQCLHPVKYEELLLTTIHEAVHCIQWHDESYVRIRGVMHDAEFYKLYNKYKDRAKALLLFEEVSHADNKFTQEANIPVTLVGIHSVLCGV